MNHEPIEPSEILFKQSLPRFVRLGIACALVFIMTWELTGFFRGGRADGNSRELIIMAGVSVVLICIALFWRDLCWILRTGELQIHRDSIAGERETKLVRTGEITKIKVLDTSDEDRIEFHIRIWLTDGDDIQSPTLRDSRRANEVAERIMERLKVPPEYGQLTADASVGT